MKEKIIATIEVIRPLNGIIAGVSVFIAVFLARRPMGHSIWLVALSCFLITGGGNAINDVVDEYIDRINKPRRPLPSGRLSRAGAILISLSFCIIGVILSGVAFAHLLFLTIPAVLLLYLYSFFLKREGLKGNLAVAILGGLPFIYGGFAVGNILPTVIPFVFAFFFHLSRELVKDIEDMKGDRGYVRTFPLVYGTKKTMIFINSILILLIVFTFFPYIKGIYKLPYLIGVILMVDIPLIFFLSLMSRGKISPARMSNALKIGMLGGMLCLVLAGI